MPTLCLDQLSAVSRVEHVHQSDKRYLTADQVAELIRNSTVTVREVEDAGLAAARRRITRRQARA
jgi:hypothetical protein